MILAENTIYYVKNLMMFVYEKVSQLVKNFFLNVKIFMTKNQNFNILFYKKITSNLSSPDF